MEGLTRIYTQIVNKASYVVKMWKSNVLLISIQTKIIIGLAYSDSSMWDIVINEDFPF